MPEMYSWPKNHVLRKGKKVSILQPKREFSHKVETEEEGNPRPFTWYHKFVFCFLLLPLKGKKESAV